MAEPRRAMKRRYTARLGSFLLAALLADGLLAQFPPKDPREQAREEMLRDRLKERQKQEERLRNLQFPYTTLPKDAPLPFHFGDQSALRRLFPAYEGLPTYPSNVPGYGGYPGATKSPDEAERQLVPALKKARPDGDRWPSWIDGGDKFKGKATPQQAVLARVADRVWFRAAGEAAYIPLAFHDRFRFMALGAQVEVRGRGEFHLLMHAGGHIRSRGPCGIDVTGMTEKEVGLRIRNVAQLWLKAGLRPFHLEMPDGTTVEFADTLIRLIRSGDRVRIENLGKSAVRFAGPYGKGELSGPEFADLWVRRAKAAPLSDQLHAKGDVTTSRVADVVTVEGGADGHVSWSGAGFQVLPGSKLQIQPLKGIDPRK